MKRASGYDVLRIVMAAVLLTAAGLKAYQLATEPVMGARPLDSRWFLIGVVEFELFFGLWLLGGELPRVTWAVALACFGVFACVSLYKALSGAASCGCFGSVPVNPWYTSLLDLTIVLSLLCWRPKPTLDDKANRFGLLKGESLMVAIISLLLGACVYSWVSHATDVRLMELGQVLEAGSVVKLQPALWIGSTFPLLGYTTIDSDIARGNWYIMLYSEGCDQCQTAIQKIIEIAKHNCVPLAVIRVHGKMREKMDQSAVLVGNLSTQFSWFVETPVLLKLRDNQVEGVLLRNDLGSMAKAKSLGRAVCHHARLLTSM